MRFRVLKNSGLQTLANYFTADNSSETTNKVTQESYYNFKVDELERPGYAASEHFLPSHYWFNSTTNLKKYLGALPYNSNTKKQLANGQYFKDLGLLFENPSSSANPNAFLELQKSILSESRYKVFFIEEDVITASEELYRSFPVYNTIRIQTLPHQLKLAKGLKNAKLLEKFCKAHIARVLKPKEAKPPQKYFIDSYDLGASGELPADMKAHTIEYLTTTETIPTKAETIVQNQVVDLNLFTVLTDDVGKEHTKFSLASAMELVKVLKENASDDQLDILMFEIRKYKIADGEPETFFQRLDSKLLIQSFFVPAFSDDINFVDTQVRQGVHYYYQIIAHSTIGKENTIIIGLPWDNTIDNFVETDWRDLSKASVRILTPRNSSPLSPEMDILPFERSDNLVTILLKNRYGSENSRPVVIDNEDVSRFSPPAVEPEKEMFFRTDETEVAIEVFRIEEAPENYRSFSPTEQTRIATVNGSGAVSFIDNIEPNKDYFYCARTVDPNGNISNPTNVIKVRIVSVDDSLPYFTKKNYDFTEFPKTYERTFRKYLLIRPSEFQSQLVETPDGPKLIGDLFGKRLVLEIESTKTGRKIDFVVKFNPPIRNAPSTKGTKPPEPPKKTDHGGINENSNWSPKNNDATIKDKVIVEDKFPKKPSLVDDTPGNFKDDKIDPFKVQPK